MKQNRYCLVLGASGGIGSAICKTLAASGWSIYLHYYRGHQKALQLQAELQRDYPLQSFETIYANLALDESAELVANQARHVRAIVVANGQAVVKLLTDTTTEEMSALWKVHVQTPARLISLLSPKLRHFDTSYVTFIGSIWGETGAASEVMYSAVKGAQHAFVKAYAKESAYSGIRVNAVAPGWIGTEMNDVISDEDHQLAMEEIPLRKIGQPEDVAEAVNFLMSGKANYITGEVLKVNGGWYT
ncbi:SDR family oxidoreductase [Sporosarcina sp. HYO08]|uniref:elongation factor P 5-aminopentanone reductase n=1 Tax=Sporosarcina sp. HYO08 TaxID=1759557 RepID=UPI0007928C3D|nr:SDR family oxidoreductase [Sporosarcina sp. HYO08]KXH80044.1 3-ketoacyl-ACP synthase [Sporosarcina sp. HYO08]